MLVLQWTRESPILERRWDVFTPSEWHGVSAQIVNHFFLETVLFYYVWVHLLWTHQDLLSLEFAFICTYQIIMLGLWEDNSINGPWWIVLFDFMVDSRTPGCTGWCWCWCCQKGCKLKSIKGFVRHICVLPHWLAIACLSYFLCTMTPVY